MVEMDAAGHLAAAEEVWHRGDKRAAIGHYDAALSLYEAANDHAQAERVLVGKGFALVSTGDREDHTAGLVALSAAKKLAEDGGRVAQAMFVGQLIAQQQGRHPPPDESAPVEGADPGDPPRSDAVDVQQPLVAFSQSVLHRSPTMLFLRGHPQRAQEESTHELVKRLGLLGTIYDPFDVASSHTQVEGHVLELVGADAMPVLVVKGTLVAAGSTLTGWTEDVLKKELTEAGVEFGEPDTSIGEWKCPPPPCSGDSSDKSAVWADLDAPTRALIELVAQDGLGDWDKKAASLGERFGPEETSSLATGAAVLQRWAAIAPEVAHRLEGNPDMPCGHTCGTCPTRDTCHLHDSLGDMEDLLAPPIAVP